MTVKHSSLAGLVAVSSVMLLVPCGTVAQEPRPCTVVLDSAGTWRQVDYGDGREGQFAGGGVGAHCEGQTTSMRSDSIAYYSDRLRFDLFGDVHFIDSTVTLDSDRSSYFFVDERLEAYENVRLVNLESGSVLTGPNLTYFRKVAGLRDEPELYASSRPTVEYRARGDTSGAEPYIVIGDEVRLRGSGAAWAWGSVTIDRSDFHATADSAELALEAGDGLLVGQAEVQSGDAEAFRLSGDTIAFTFVDNQLDWVQAVRQAEANSADWRMRSDTVEFFLVDGVIRGGNAWGDSTRSTAESDTYTLVADSLVVEAPNQELKQVRGYGLARAISSSDSADTEPDWVAGDTVVARFDTTATGQRILVELEAIGNAQAFYRIHDPLRASALPDINYSRGKRILAHFAEFGIQQVDVVGEADGVHVEPIPQPERR
jgi:hypothetical protein